VAALGAASARARTVLEVRPGTVRQRIGNRVSVDALGDRPGEVCVSVAGINREGVVPAGDRRRLERLTLYMARSPLASERLSARANDRVRYELASRWRDGTTHLLIEHLDLIGPIAATIPPPLGCFGLSRSSGLVRVFHMLQISCSRAADPVITSCRDQRDCASRAGVLPEHQAPASSRTTATRGA
jgi:hypothetical protein